MAYDPMLEDVKIGIGITGNYQDATVNGYIEEVKSFAIDGGVKPGNITTGLVVRGVSDIWNFGACDGELSEYFKQRVTQLAYK